MLEIKMKISIKALLLFVLIAIHYFVTVEFLMAGQANGEECLVPCDQIVSGGPPKDDIPAIDSPKFISAAEHDELYGSSNELVVGVFYQGEARDYPAAILNWHEIVNDRFNGIPVSVTYCPATWSGIGYQPTSEGEANTLGTTGKLYENNLVFYGRQANTYWSQILGVGIKGEHMGEKLPIIPLVQTTWDAWKALHPETVVLS